MKLWRNLAPLAVLWAAAPAHAAFIVDFNEVGANVVATGAGGIDTADLTLGDAGLLALGEGMAPALAALFVTPGSETNVTQWLFSGGPSAFGTGGSSDASAETGDSFVFSPASLSQFQILLPGDYVSGAPLANSETWNDATFNSLGLGFGTQFIWAWGSGADADYFEIVVPEPGSIGLLSVGLAGLFRFRRARRQVAGARAVI